MPRKATTKKATTETTTPEKKERKPRKPADTESLTKRLKKLVYSLLDMVQKEEGLDTDDAIEVVKDVVTNRCEQYEKEQEAREKIAELKEEYGDMIDFKIK